MEQQISEILTAVTCMRTEQKLMVERLDKVESELASVNAPQTRNKDGNNTPVSDGGVIQGVNTAAGPHHTPDPPSAVGAVGHSPQVNFNTSAGDNSIQDEYMSIKDKVSSVKIPQELRVSLSKAGIKKENTVAANIISNSAKYVETAIKLMWNIDDNVDPNQLVELFSVLKAHIDYLRQEQSALVVSSQFGAQTSQLFRNLNRGTCNLDDRQLENLLKAVQITSHSSDAHRQHQHTSYRGGWRGAAYHQAYRGGRGRGWSHGGSRGGHSGGATGTDSHTSAGHNTDD